MSKFNTLDLLNKGSDYPIELIEARIKAVERAVVSEGKESDFLNNCEPYQALRKARRILKRRRKELC